MMGVVTVAVVTEEAMVVAAKVMEAVAKAVVAMAGGEEVEMVGVGTVAVAAGAGE